MSPVLGDVNGAECPSCEAELELGEEFHEGQEVYCDCGAVLHLDSVKAVYTVKLSRLDIPKEDSAHE
jgi:hypothetical protein